MAAENVPTVVLELDRPRTLAFTLGAARRFQKATGKRLDQLDQSAFDPLGDLPVLVWAMAAGEDRSLTLEQVEELLHPGNLERVAAAVEQVLLASLPEASADPLPEMPEAKVAPAPMSDTPTSTSSGPSAESS